MGAVAVDAVGFVVPAGQLEQREAAPEVPRFAVLIYAYLPMK